MRLPVCLLVLAACSAAPRAPSPAPVLTVAAPVLAPPPPKLRLSGDVRPLGYEVALDLLPEQEQFEAEIDIELELRAPTALLWMHGEGLTIVQAHLRAGEQKVDARPVVPAGEGKGFLGFALSQKVGPGKARLHVRYRGPLSRRDNDGLFRQKVGGDWYAYSDFEPTDARRAFPCFDEPSYKVPWQVTLRVHREHVALSNMPVESESEEPGGLKRVRFRRSPPLPSYLVAMAAGPFEIVEAGRAGKHNTPLRIIALRGRGAEAGYAKKSSADLFNALEDYFGIPYPYEKLDQIAVPKFSGAMENPGLITYAQSILLTPPEEETAQSRRRYGSVAAHEMAHQWFGNLVTLRYWDDIWLNESFASWMEERVIEKWQPSWDVPAQRTRSRGYAMHRDSLTTTRSVRQPIESTHDIHNAFDTITYQKGQALLDMFERWLGEDRFREGVRRYLSDHAFGNAAAEDFIAALSAVGAKDLGPSLKSFLEQPGVPLITVEPRCEPGRPPILNLRQSRYLPAGATAPKALWQVPICVRYGKSRACTLLTASEGELALPGARLCGAPEKIDLVVANAEAAGYYRVRYGGALLQRQLRGGGADLSAPERVALLDDLAALLRSGDLPADEVVDLALRLSGDSNRHVLQGVMEIVAGLRAHLVSRELRPAYARLVRGAFGARARALGLRSRPKDGDELRLLRRSLVGLVGIHGEDQALRKEAVRMTRAWLADRRAIAPEDIDLVLRLSARGGDGALFDQLLAAARAATTHVDRMRLLSAVGSFSEPALVSRSLALVLSDDMDIRETSRLLYAALEEEEGAELAYRLVKEHFDELLRRLPQNGGARLIGLASAFCDEAHRADVEAFFQERAQRLPGGPRDLRQVQEQIRLCGALKEAQTAPVTALLRRR